MTSDNEEKVKPSPLWCADNEPHAEHWAYNRFNGRDYCSGRPFPYPADPVL